MKTMMMQSLVVIGGCGTPLWSKGGKGETEFVGKLLKESSRTDGEDDDARSFTPIPVFTTGLKGIYWIFLHCMNTFNFMTFTRG